MMPALSALLLSAVAPIQVDAPNEILQQIDVPSPSIRAAGAPIEIQLDLDGAPSRLILEPFSVRSPEFRVLVKAPDGAVLEMPAPAATTWRGHIEGRPDSFVTASITDRGLQAVATDPILDLNWEIEPAGETAPGLHSILSGVDAELPEGSCGVTDHSVPVSYSGTPPTAELGTGLQICEIACDSDEEFFQDSGSDVDETIRAIDFIMTRVTTIYERDANVTFQITATVVRPTDNVYSATDPSNLLGQFRNEWRSNFNFVTADLAHLFTGKDLDGFVIGVAFVGGVCNSSLKFGLSQSRFTTTVTARVQLTAHEIGHNFNAGHCDGNGDCRIMCASLGGCTGIGTSFGTGSASVISNFAASRSCLQDLSPPLTLPVFDNFESTTLDGDIWISSQGIRINGDASGEPSGVRSLEFSRNGTGQAVNDFVISNKVLLGGLPLVEVRCEVQPVGAPALSFIILEVLDVNREWVALDGAGASGFNTPFQEISAVLPQSALHDEAQFRIRSVFANGTVGGGRWFVDDFQIMESDCGQVVPYCTAAPNSVSLGGATVTSVGSTSITANDLQLVGLDLPTGSFAIWIYGEEQIQTALGDGFLCVNGPTIFRLAVVQSDSLGINLLTLDQGSLAPGSTIVANQTVNFQAWYRDAVGAGFNLTNALSVTFCP